MKRRTTSRANGKTFALDLKRIEVTVIVGFLLLLGSATLTSALDTSTASFSSPGQIIRAEIASLLAKVEQLKQQLKELQRGGMATSTPPQTSDKPKRICPLLARVLLSGTRGDDVANLQDFLAEEGYFDRMHISSYFGPLTESALKKWQAAQGIIGSGSASTTGWGAVGPRTREFILKRCGGWKEDKPFSVAPPFSTSTWPGIDKKGPNSAGNVCPALVMPPADSCDGAFRLEWRSTSGSSLKCLAWKCHSDDDGEDLDDDSDEDADDVDDDSDDDADDADNDSGEDADEDAQSTSTSSGGSPQSSVRSQEERAQLASALSALEAGLRSLISKLDSL